MMMTSKIYSVPTVWSFRQLVISLVLPATPTLTTTDEPTAARVQLAYTSAHNVLSRDQAEGVTGTVGWLAYSNANAVTQIDVTSNTYQQLFPTAAGDAIAASDHYEVQEGRALAARLSVGRFTGGVEKSTLVALAWFDEDGQLISTTNGSAVTTTAMTLVQPFVTGTAPTGAKTVRVLWQVTAATVGQEFRMDSAVLRGNTTATLPITGSGPSTVLIERSIDNGATYYPVRGFPTGAPSGLVYDNEAPFNTVLAYRLTVTSSATGSSVTSLPNTLLDQLDVPVVWLKDVSDPARNAHFPVEDNWLQTTRFRARSVQKGLGSSKPSVIRGEGSFEQFSASFIIIDQAQMDRFVELVEGDHVMILQSGKKTRYVEVSGDYSILEWLWDDLHNEQYVWKATVPFIEVGTP